MTSKRSRNLSRRRILQATGVLPLSVAAVGLGRSSRASAAEKPAFDITKPGTALFTNKQIPMVRTAMQSLVVDIEAGHIYVLQLVQANTSLPGDEPGDETYARRLERGDLTLSRLDMTGKVLGVMYLKFFGHGVSMGMERDGDQLFLWTEIDNIPKGAGEGRGSKLTRFQFEDGALLDAEHDTTLFRRELLPDVTQTTCNIDQSTNRLVMRYWDGSAFRYALFDLDHVKAESSSYEPLYDIATPAEVNGVFQGYVSYGDYLYTIDGTKYGDDNPPPPDGQGNAQLTRIRWSTGTVDRRWLDQTGIALHRREPEGLTVAIGSPDGGSDERPRLYSGFATSVSADSSADRLCSIFYRDTWVIP